jgi:fumarylacetoacetate (FAA) hydrolase
LPKHSFSRRTKRALAAIAITLNLLYFTRNMKLVCYDSGTGPRAGVVVDDHVLDAATLLGEQSLRDVRALLELPGEPLLQLESALASARAAQGAALSTARLRAPILQPPTVRDFMVYEGHASAGGTRQLPDAWYRLPIFYFSNPLCIFGPEDAVPYPSASQQLDYELELAAVVGREGSNIAEADAPSYIAGFTIFNDWSCRDLQRDEMQARLGPAKGKDSASSLGPWIVTPDELAPFFRDGRLHLRCTVKVNGVQWAENNTGIMYHAWGAMIERASRDSRIVPGDVLGGGTVTGGSIGEAIRNGFPARYLEPGDVVEIAIEGIGVLRNTIVPKLDPNLNYRFAAPPTGSPDY